MEATGQGKCEMNKKKKMLLLSTLPHTPKMYSKKTLHSKNSVEPNNLQKRKS